jgi:hypothetical protein
MSEPGLLEKRKQQEMSEDISKRLIADLQRYKEWTKDYDRFPWWDTDKHYDKLSPERKALHDKIKQNLARLTAGA